MSDCLPGKQETKKWSDEFVLADDSIVNGYVHNNICERILLIRKALLGASMVSHEYVKI